MNNPSSKDSELLRTPLRGNLSIPYRQRTHFILLGLLLVGAHFIFLMSYFEPAISTPDANSYFVQAKLLAKEGKTYVQPESALQYIGVHWNHTGDNRYYCTHAPGLPVILALVYRFFGPKATLWVNPLMASLSLLGLFLLCRLWVGQGWGLLAAALMAVNPFANEHALFGDSHTAVCFFLIWALFFLAQWSKTHSPWWALAAGLFIGMIPTIRYPEILYLPAIGIFVLFHYKNDKAFWSSVFAGAIGAAIPIAALCLRNQIAYGGFWKTGYAIAIGQKTFGWNYFVDSFLPFLIMLLANGCGLVFVTGIIGISILSVQHYTWRCGALFAMLVLPITLLYMSYYWGADPQSMRFLLPTFYIYTIASVWLLSVVCNNRYSSAFAASIVLLLITIVWGLPQSVRPMQHLKNNNAVLAKITNVVEKHVEPGSILIANEGINQHLDFIGCWRLADLWVLKPRPPGPPRKFAPNLNIPLPLQNFRNIEARQRYVNLEGKELLDTFTDDIWHWASDIRKVYWLAKEEQINDYKRQLSKHYQLVTVEKIELPGRRLGN
ncbi:MAG: ArnT family glycosyltransferase, partial [Sedimentisphaerales bacterium]